MDAEKKRINTRAERGFSSTTKEYAKKRAGHRCEVCGATGTECFPLEVHHLLPIAVIRERYPHLSCVAITSLYNSLVVCRECHKRENQASFASPEERFHELLTALALHYLILQQAGLATDEQSLVTKREDPVREASYF